MPLLSFLMFIENMLIVHLQVLNFVTYCSMGLLRCTSTWRAQSRANARLVLCTSWSSSTNRAFCSTWNIYALTCQSVPVMVITLYINSSEKVDHYNFLTMLQATNLHNGELVSTILIPQICKKNKTIPTWSYTAFSFYGRNKKSIII